MGAPGIWTSWRSFLYTKAGKPFSSNSHIRLSLPTHMTNGVEETCASTVLVLFMLMVLPYIRWALLGMP